MPLGGEQMKALTALAMTAILVAFSVTSAQATDKTAKLNDPATSGQTQVAPLRAVEKASIPASVGRTGLSESELERIRGSVREQIQAMSTRDAAGAYALLTPLIKDYYKDSNAFLNVLTTQLKPLSNAKTFAFSDIVREDTDALQSVTITDAQGREWNAQFRLQRQGDGSWGIAGCQVEPVDGQRV